MSTLTIELSDELAARLAAASERQQMSAAEIVRESLAKTLPVSEPLAEEQNLDELMKEGVGCVSSGVGDLSTNPKHLKGYGRSSGV